MTPSMSESKIWSKSSSLVGAESSTPKFVFYVTKSDIFKSQPYVRRIGNDDGVVPMRPYYLGGMEFVQNWRTWVSLTEEFPFRD